MELFCNYEVHGDTQYIYVRRYLLQKQARLQKRSKINDRIKFHHTTLNNTLVTDIVRIYCENVCGS